MTACRCDYEFKFDPVYEAGAPSSLPANKWLGALLGEASRLAPRGLRLLTVVSVWLFVTPLLGAGLHRGAMHYTTTTGWAQFGVRFESLYALSVDMLCGVIVVGSTLVAVLVAASMWDVSASHAHTVHLSINRLVARLQSYKEQVDELQREQLPALAVTQATAEDSSTPGILGPEAGIGLDSPQEAVYSAQSGSSAHAVGGDGPQLARSDVRTRGEDAPGGALPATPQAQAPESHGLNDNGVRADMAIFGAVADDGAAPGGMQGAEAAAHGVPAEHTGRHGAAGGGDDAGAVMGQDGDEADNGGLGDQPQLFLEDPWEADPDGWPDDGGPIMIEDMLGMTGDLKTAMSYMLAAHILLGMLIAAVVFLPGLLGRSFLSSLRKKSAWPLVFAPEALFWGRGVSGGVPLSLHGMWASNLAATAQDGLAASDGEWLHPTGLFALAPQLPQNEDRVGEWPLNPDDTYEVLVGYVVLVISASVCAGMDELARWAVVARKRMVFSQTRATLSLKQLWRGIQAGDLMPDGPMAGTPCTPGDAELLQYDIERSSMLLGPVSSSSPLLAALMVWAKVALMFLARMMIQPVLIGLACDALLQPFLGQTYAHVLAEYVANFFLAMLYRWALGMFVLLLGVTVLLTVRDLLHPRALAAQLRAFAPREAVFEPMAKRSLSLQCRSAASTMTFLTVMLAVALYLPLALTGWTPAGQSAHDQLSRVPNGNMTTPDPSILWKQLHHPPWESWGAAPAAEEHNGTASSSDSGDWCGNQQRHLEALLPPRLHHAAAAGLPPRCGGVSGVFLGGVNASQPSSLPATPARIVDLVRGDGQPELQYEADIQYVDGHSLLGHTMDTQLVRVQLRVQVTAAAAAKRPYGAISRYLTATDHSLWQSFAPWLCLRHNTSPAAVDARAAAVAPPLYVCSAASGVPLQADQDAEVPLLALEAVNLTHLLGIFPGVSDLVQQQPLLLVDHRAQVPEHSAPASNESVGLENGTEADTGDTETMDSHAQVSSDGTVDVTDAEALPADEVAGLQLAGARSIQFSFISQMLLPIKDTEYSMPLHKYPAEARQSLAVLQRQISQRLAALQPTDVPPPSQVYDEAAPAKADTAVDDDDTDSLEDVISDIFYFVLGPYADLPALVGEAAAWVSPALVQWGSRFGRTSAPAEAPAELEHKLAHLHAWQARVNDTMRVLQEWEDTNMAALSSWDVSATDTVPLTLGDAMDVASKLQHSAPLVGTVWHSFRLYRHAAEVSALELRAWLSSLPPAERAAVVQRAKHLAHRAASQHNEQQTSWLRTILWAASQPQIVFTRAFDSTAEAGMRAVTDFLFSTPNDADTYDEASRQSAAGTHDTHVLLLNATMPLGAVWPAVDFRLRSAMAACVRGDAGSSGAPPASEQCLRGLGSGMPLYEHQHHVPQPDVALPALGNFSIVGSVWGHLPAGQMPHVSSTRLTRRAPVGHERAAGGSVETGISNVTPLHRASALLQPSISAHAEELYTWFAHSMFQDARNDSMAIIDYMHDSCSSLVGVPRSTACGVLAWVVGVAYAILLALPIVLLRWGARLALEHTPRPVLFLASYHSLPIQKLADLMVAEIGLTILMDPFRTLMWWWAIAWITGFARLLGIRRYVLPQADEVLILRPMHGVPVETQPGGGSEDSPPWRQVVVEGQELPALSLPADEMRDIAREAGPARMPKSEFATASTAQSSDISGAAPAPAAPEPAGQPQEEANGGAAAHGDNQADGEAVNAAQREAAAARAVVRAVAGKAPNAATMQHVVPLGDPSVACKWAVSSRLPLYYLRIPDMDRTVAVVQRLPVRHSTTERSPTHVAWRDSCFWVSDPSQLPMGTHDVLDYVEQWREDYQKAEAVATLVMHRAETREAAAKYRRFTVGGAIWELQGGGRRRRGRAERALGGAGADLQEEAALGAADAGDEDEDGVGGALPQGGADAGTPEEGAALPEDASETSNGDIGDDYGKPGDVGYATMLAQRRQVRRALRALDATEKGNSVAIGATAVASLQDTVPQEARDWVLARVPEAAVLPDEAILSQMRLPTTSLAGTHDFSQQILMHTPDKTPVQRFLALLDLVSVYTLRIPLLVVLAVITLWLGMLWILNVSFALGRLAMAFAGMPVSWMHDPWGVFMGGFVLLSLLEWVFLVHMGTFAVVGSLIRTVNFDVVRRSRGLLGAFLRGTALVCIVALGASHRLSLRVALAFRGDVHVPRVASLTRLLRTLAVFVVMVILIPAQLGTVLLSLRDPMHLSVPQQAEQYACNLRAVQQLTAEVQFQLQSRVASSCSVTDAQWAELQDTHQKAFSDGDGKVNATRWLSDSLSGLSQRCTAAVGTPQYSKTTLQFHDFGAWMHMAGHLPPTWAHMQEFSSPWQPMSVTASSAAALGNATWGWRGNGSIGSHVAQVAGDAERAFDATAKWLWDVTVGEGPGQVLPAPPSNVSTAVASQPGASDIILRGQASRGMWRWLQWYQLQRMASLNDTSSPRAALDAGPSTLALEHRLHEIQSNTCPKPQANRYGVPAALDGNWLHDSGQLVLKFINDVAALPLLASVPSLLGVHLVLGGGLRGFMTLWFVGFAVIAGMNQGLWMGCCGRRAQRLPQRVAHSVLRGRAMWLYKNVVAPSSKALVVGAVLATLLQALMLYSMGGVLQQGNLEQWCAVTAQAAAALDSSGRLPPALQPVLGDTWAPRNFTLGVNFSSFSEDPQLARELPAWVHSSVMHPREWSLFGAALVPHVAASAVDPGTAPPRMPLMQLAAAAIPRTLWPLPLSGELERAWGGAVHGMLASPATALALCGQRWAGQMHTETQSGLVATALDRFGAADPIGRLSAAPMIMHLAPLLVGVLIVAAMELGSQARSLHEHLYRREYAVGENLLPLAEEQRQRQAGQARGGRRRHGGGD